MSARLDRKVESHVNGLSVVLAAESSGKWQPSPAADAKLRKLYGELLARRLVSGGES